jgi:mono/diheme cytochrome c family protein
VTFRSHRAADEKDREFLASSDNWFRPTMLKTGPDGALYIAAMYRLVIEHPEWIPAEMQRRLDLRAGADKGRIYRIVPDGVALRSVPNLAKLSSPELVAALDSLNGWQRDTAQRLLIERGDKSVVEKLEHHAKAAKDAKVRVQALWTLHGLGGITPRILVDTLKDAHSAVREHAVRLSESQTGYRELLDALLARLSDSSPRVRYQLAFTLGEWSDPRAAEALLKLARDEDETIRNAGISSAPRHAKEMLALAKQSPADDRVRTILPMLQKLVANPPMLVKAIAMVERTNTLSAAQRTERAKVLEQYTAVPNLKANAQNGAALFRQNCAQCHRLRGEGAEIGPDLGTLAGKPVETLVTAILDPNAAMEARYQNFNAVL